MLSDTDKSQMEETLRSEVGDVRNTRIVCRRGEAWLPQNLALANVAAARSIVVVGAGDDAATVKVLLAGALSPPTHPMRTSWPRSAMLRPRPL